MTVVPLAGLVPYSEYIPILVLLVREVDTVRSEGELKAISDKADDLRRRVSLMIEALESFTGEDTAVSTSR